MAGDEDSHLLILKIDDVRVIATMLKTIQFKDTALVSSSFYWFKKRIP